MGTWSTVPFGNDNAADEIDDVGKAAHAFVMKALQEDDNNDLIDSAAWLYLRLGKVYIWPIDHLDSDRELLLEKLTMLLNEDPNYIARWISEDDCDNAETQAQDLIHALENHSITV